MGGGQQEEALRLLRQCATNGEWLFLKNLHLVIPWVATLQKELNVLRPHADFRLWLTSEPHDEFPSIMLATSLKVRPPLIRGIASSDSLKAMSPSYAAARPRRQIRHCDAPPRSGFVPRWRGTPGEPKNELFIRCLFAASGSRHEN